MIQFMIALKVAGLMLEPSRYGFKKFFFRML